MCLVWISNTYTHVIKLQHHFCVVWICICSKCTVTPRRQTKLHRIHQHNMWTLLEYSFPLLHIFPLYKAVIIYTVSFTRNTHALYARYVHRSSPVKASHRWIGESLLVLTRLECKKHEIMFTSGMWNDSSGKRFEVLTEALAKIQSSGMRCCVTGQVVHDVSRIVLSSSSRSSSPLRIVISHLYCISSSSSSSSSLIHSTSLPSLPTSQQFSTDTASTIPTDLPHSVASHYPHHQYLQHAGCLFTLLLFLARLAQKKNALWSLEVWGAPCPLIRHHIKRL